MTDDEERLAAVRTYVDAEVTGLVPAECRPDLDRLVWFLDHYYRREAWWTAQSVAWKRRARDLEAALEEATRPHPVWAKIEAMAIEAAANPGPTLGWWRKRALAWKRLAKRKADGLESYRGDCVAKLERIRHLEAALRRVLDESHGDILRSNAAVMAWRVLNNGRGDD